MKKNSQKKEKSSLIALPKLWWGKLPAEASIKDYFLIFIGVVVILSLLFLWKDEFAKFLITVIGGGLFILQIFTSNRRATAAEKTADSMRETVDLNEKGHIAERFKNAIEHLGNESASIRLGGIYALHNLARDVDNYREQVFEILCAHIRETTTRENYKPRIINEFQMELPTIEIQTTLNLLFVNEKDRKIYNNLSANLEGAILQGARLTGAHLEFANLSNADLILTFFIGANLKHANLFEAKLQNAILVKSDMRGAVLLMSQHQSGQSSDDQMLIKQLLTAKTLYEAMIPEKIKEEIHRQNPKILEKPDDEQETGSPPTLK